jgi:aryl-alcohol dehydrogenase-like predicted oxidoreductase
VDETHYYPRMRQRSLGAATVTAVGVGDLRLALATRRGLDARDVERALQDAFELGITLVDVADEDGAERLAGDVVRALRLRDRVTVATRVPALSPLAILPVRYVQDRIEASLRATRLEVLPYVQLPLRLAWLSSSAWPELAGTCARLVREGKVLQFGALVDDPEELIERASAAPPPAPTSSLLLSLGDVTAPPPPPPVDKPRALDEWFVGASIPYSLCERTGDPIVGGTLPILARRPLGGGALAGSLGPGMKLAMLDERHAIAPSILERIAVAMARLAPYLKAEPPAARSCDAARAILERTPRRDDVVLTTAAEFALRFAIDRGAIVLPRLHRREHIAEAIAAAAASPLPPSTSEQMFSIFDSREVSRD